MVEANIAMIVREANELWEWLAHNPKLDKADHPSLPVLEWFQQCNFCELTRFTNEESGNEEAECDDCPMNGLWPLVDDKLHEITLTGTTCLCEQNVDGYQTAYDAWWGLSPCDYCPKQDNEDFDCDQCGGCEDLPTAYLIVKGRLAYMIHKAIVKHPLFK